MKLLWCDSCHDVVNLVPSKWRKCSCGKVGGQYNFDGITATIGGVGRIFGISNFFLRPDWPLKTDEERKELRDKYWPEGKESDCWWGSYEGDVQLFLIKSSDGPRLKIKSEVIFGGYTDNPVVAKGEHEKAVGKSVRITVIDRRKYLVDGRFLKSVLIPKYDGIKIGKDNG